MDDNKDLLPPSKPQYVAVDIASVVAHCCAIDQRACKCDPGWDITYKQS